MTTTKYEDRTMPTQISQKSFCNKKKLQRPKDQFLLCVSFVCETTWNLRRVQSLYIEKYSLGFSDSLFSVLQMYYFIAQFLWSTSFRKSSAFAYCHRRQSGVNSPGARRGFSGILLQNTYRYTNLKQIPGDGRKIGGASAPPLFQLSPGICFKLVNI